LNKIVRLWLYHNVCSCQVKSGDYCRETLAADRKKMCMALFFYLFGCGRLDLDNKLLQRPDVFGIVLALITSRKRGNGLSL
jgi:hypothetical protein